MKLCLIFAIAVIATAYEHSDTEAREDIFQEMDQIQGEPTLRSAVATLRRVAPVEFASHVHTISKHSELIQDDKAKAYAHNFKASKKAIMSAIAALHGELNVGHRHDKAVLNKQRNLLNAAIRKSLEVGRATVNKYRFKACPTKRLEIEANSAKKNAKRKMEQHENGKVCPLGTRFRDMDIHKGTPNLGTELRSKWNRARAVYVKLQAVYNRASTKHAAAVRKYNTAMSKFRTSVKLEASNAYTTCTNARGEYAALVREVASNVNTRKQTYIATLVIKCYIKNLTNNRGAKDCADKAKRANTNRWNIVAGPLTPCNSKATNAKIFGPPNWKPSSRNCHLKHWHEALHKERIKKELDTKERARKEKDAKEKAKKAEKKAKELDKKEKAAKKKEKADKAAKRERKAKADAKRAKELRTKESNAKEKSRKAKENKKKVVAEGRTKESKGKEKATKAKAKEKASKNVYGWAQWNKLPKSYGCTTQGKWKVCLGGCCSGKNDAVLRHCGGRNRADCIKYCQAACQANSNCASFEMGGDRHQKYVSGPNGIVKHPRKCEYSKFNSGQGACMSPKQNYRPAGNCGLDLFIKNSAKPKKRVCDPAEIKGQEYYTWEAAGRHCYHIIAGRVLDQDYTSKSKSRCNKRQFRKTVAIGRGHGISSHYPNGDSRGCPGGRARSAQLTIKRDPNGRAGAVVTEPRTCYYNIVITTPKCRSSREIEV